MVIHGALQKQTEIICTSMDFKVTVMLKIVHLQTKSRIFPTFWKKQQNLPVFLHFVQIQPFWKVGTISLSKSKGIILSIQPITNIFGTWLLNVSGSCLTIFLWLNATSSLEEVKNGWILLLWSIVFQALALLIYQNY